MFKRAAIFFFAVGQKCFDFEMKVRLLVFSAFSDNSSADWEQNHLPQWCRFPFQFLEFVTELLPPLTCSILCCQSFSARRGSHDILAWLLLCDDNLSYPSNKPHMINKELWVTSPSDSPLLAHIYGESFLYTQVQASLRPRVGKRHSHCSETAQPKVCRHPRDQPPSPLSAGGSQGLAVEQGFGFWTARRA